MNSAHQLRHLCAIGLVALACLPRLAPADEAIKPPVALGKCMMWKVSSGTATVYLAGSMHLATPQIYPLPSEMEEAFAKSDTLVVEVNINALDQQKIMQLVQTKGMYPGNLTLSTHIKKEIWQGVKDACGNLGLPAEGIEKLKPWVVSMTLQLMQIQKFGFDPKLGVDKHFLDMAAGKKMKIDELETADFQINLLSSFDDKMQEKGLVLVLAEMKDLKDDIAHLTDAWIAGDAEAVDAQLTKKQKEHPETIEVAQKLIYDRNAPMAKKIEDYLKGDKTVFVLVGAAHMVGDKGIVKILQNDKYKVEQSPATHAPKATKD